MSSLSSNNFCGIWNQPCSVGQENQWDYIEYVDYQGSQNASEGTHTTTRTIYAPNSQCSVPLMSIYEDAYWSLDGYSNITQVRRVSCIALHFIH